MEETKTRKSETSNDDMRKAIEDQYPDHIIACEKTWSENIYRYIYRITKTPTCGHARDTIYICQICFTEQKAWCLAYGKATENKT